MLRNLLIVTIRNIKRQKAFASLNIIGLSIGLAACLIISLYAYDELSYDRFHSKAERIYRINQTFIWGDTDDLFGSTGPAVMHAIDAEVPEFEAMTRVHPTGPNLVTNLQDGAPIVYEEESILAVDANFLQIFSFPLTEGHSATALVKPNSLILTESTATKYFGTTNVVGKQLLLGERNRQTNYTITGIAQDVPRQSHIQFDFLMSMSSLPRVSEDADSWMWTTFVTFGLLREDANPDQVAQKIAAVPGKYLESFLQKYQGISYEEFLASGEQWDLFMQPLLDIHLHSSNVYSRLNTVGDIRLIYILGIVAGFILLISLINYINLSTARSSTRAKEVGIRKVIGSGRKMLVYQFITESIAYCLTAMVISLFLVEILATHFQYLSGKQLEWHVLESPMLLLVFAGLCIMIGIVGGIYPAFYLSSFPPAQVLKSKLSNGIKDSSIRNMLVTVQFTLSIGLIACTLIINSQVEYWKNMEVGFDKENKIVIEHAERLGSSSEAFKTELLKNPLIQEITFAADTPPYMSDFDNFTRKGAEEKSISVNYTMTDQHFIPVFGLKLLHGRNFSETYHDSLNVIVSRSLTQAFGFSEPKEALNSYLHYYDVDFKIIGIMEDINANLSDQSFPTALFYKTNPIYHDSAKEFAIHLSRDATHEETLALLGAIENQWYAANSSAPFSYTFVDKEYMQAFEGTVRFNRMLSSLAGLAVFIACLGLIGLVAFIIEKRNKEIGIRKVLGASAPQILLLLFGNFGKLLLLSYLVAVPVSWYVMDLWLDNFALRTSISLLTFLLAGGIMLIAALSTTSFQTWKATKINPVDYLKEE